MAFSLTDSLIILKHWPGTTRGNWDMFVQCKVVGVYVLGTTQSAAAESHCPLLPTYIFREQPG